MERTQARKAAELMTFAATLGIHGPALADPPESPIGSGARLP